MKGPMWNTTSTLFPESEEQGCARSAGFRGVPFSWSQVVNLVLSRQVLISMVYLPDTMPASFQSTYTPVESAGTDAQIRHLARLMASQMTAAGIGPGETSVDC